jgi:hypothetical protein
MSGTIISTPTLSSPTIIQVGTPFSYSFTYSENITAIDTPVYYFNGKGPFSGGGSNSNSTVITAYPYIDEIASGYGPIYTVSNMSASRGDVLECVLPILPTDYIFSSESYVTFGGPSLTYIQGGPPTSNDTTRTHLASFGGFAQQFRYGLCNSTQDSLKYTVLAGTPASSFRITLARPLISNCSVTATIEDNVMRVLSMYGSGYGQVTVGMIFETQGDLTEAIRVTGYQTGAFGSGVFGEEGYYTIAPVTGSNTINMSNQNNLNSTNVSGSGDVVFSTSMTPSSGTAQFEISTRWTYYPPGA